MSDATESAPRKTLLGILMAVFVVLAIAVAWVWRNGPTQPDVDEGRGVVEKFLELVRSGQTKQAWDSTTAEFKSAQGRETFVHYVETHPLLAKPLSFVSIQTVTIQNSPRAEYVYRATEGSGTVRLLAGNDRGAWRVDRVAIDGQPSAAR